MISIIIIVKNEREIVDTLRGIQRNKKPDTCEIIVVDASLGNLNDIRDEFTDVKWINYIQSHKKQITLPEQRNIGIKKAKGNIIVFIDANCIPEKDWLIHLVNPILKEGERVVFGRAKSLYGKTIHDQYFDNLNNKKYIDELTTINLAIRKDVFKDVGLFDESFEYGEDVDFAWRCIDAGVKIRYEKRAVISHDWGDTKRNVIRSFRYGEAKYLLYKKHTNRLSRLITKDYFVVIYVLFWLLSPITIVFPFYPLLLLIPIAKNIHDDPLTVIKSHLIYALGFIYKAINYKTYEK